MATNNYRVEINHQAMHELAEHVAFISRVSRTAAKKLRREILKQIRSLETSPYRCPVFDTEYTAQEYHKLLVDRYLILFTIDEQENIVSIDYVWDTRSDNWL